MTQPWVSIRVSGDIWHAVMGQIHIQDRFMEPSYPQPNLVLGDLENSVVLINRDAESPSYSPATESDQRPADS